MIYKDKQIPRRVCQFYIAMYLVVAALDQAGMLPQSQLPSSSIDAVLRVGYITTTMNSFVQVLFSL